MRRALPWVLLGLAWSGAPITAGATSLDATVAPPFDAWRDTAIVTIADLRVTEGDTGSTTFTAEVRLSWHSPLEVEVQALAIPANENDYSFTPTRLWLQPGGVAAITGQVHGDLIYEGNEGLRLFAIGAPERGLFVHSVGGVVTIVDDDQARAPYLSITGTTVLEGDEGLTVVTLEVRMEPAATMPVVVAYYDFPETAERRSDYNQLSGVLEFAPGEVAKTISLEIIGDRRPEGDEFLQVALADSARALLRNRSAVVHIKNDDVRPDGAAGAPPPGDVIPPLRDAGVILPPPPGDAGPPPRAGDAALPPLAPDAALPPLAPDAGAGELPEPPGPQLADGCHCSIGARAGATPFLLVVAVAVLGLLRRRRRA